MKKSFSNTLKELRINAGLTQKQVYEILGVPQSTFSSWEIGKAEPSASMTLRLCEIYGVKDILHAFGYDGYNKDGSILLNISEIDLIEKYRNLDPHGKKMVDFTLHEEWERSVSSSPGHKADKLPAEGPEYPLSNAAHVRTDIEIPEWADVSGNGIMNDENF